MTELIRKSDAIHAVLHNTGDAAVAAVQEIEGIEIVISKYPEDFGKRDKEVEGPFEVIVRHVKGANRCG